MNEATPPIEAAPAEDNSTQTKSLRHRIISHPLTHLLAALVILGLIQGFVVKLFVVPSGSMEQTFEVGDRILVNRLPQTLSGSQHTPGNGDIVVFSTEQALWPSNRTTPYTGFAAQMKYWVKFVAGDLIGIGPTTDHMLLKRVIGTPGQTVECCSVDGKLRVDGVEIDEPYIFEDLPYVRGASDCSTTPASLRCFAPVTVPEGMLLVLGDHRGASSDGITNCRGLDPGDPAAQNCARWVRIGDVIGEPFVRVWPLNRIGGID